MHPVRDNVRILAAAMIGTAIECYDFFIYATAAALVFGPLFFPAQSHAAQTLLAFVTFGVALVARPIGAVAFGHFGDRVGRKSTLVAALLLMGAATLAIGLLPTYATAGWVAPLLLCTMRFGQGLGLGGEWGGAALLAVENAPPGWEARFGMATQLGVPIGFLAANGLFIVLGLTLDDAAFAAWGWRVPFLASAVLVAIGLWVRLSIGETPAFRAALERAPPAPVPLARLFARHTGAVLAGSAGVIVVFALFYLATAWALAEGVGRQGYPRQALLAVQLVANLFMTAGMVFSAWLADRSSPERALAIGSIATFVVGLGFGAGIASGSLGLAAATLCIAMTAMGFTNGSLGAWLTRLFPVGVRYSGMSLAYNVGGIVGGAATPILAQLLSEAGAVRYTGLLLCVAAAASFLGIRLSRRVEPFG